MDRELIHESLHQQDAAAGVTQEILFGQGIRQVTPIEPISFVADRNGDLSGLLHQGEVDLFPSVISIAVDYGIDHAFADGHSDPMQIIFVEADFGCRFQNGLFRDVDALERGVQQSLELFLFSLLFRHSVEFGKRPTSRSIQVKRLLHRKSS